MKPTLQVLFDTQHTKILRTWLLKCFCQICFSKEIILYIIQKNCKAIIRQLKCFFEEKNVVNCLMFNVYIKDKISFHLSYIYCLFKKIIILKTGNGGG